MIAVRAHIVRKGGGKLLLLLLLLLLLATAGLRFEEGQLLHLPCLVLTVSSCRTGRNWQIGCSGKGRMTVTRMCVWEAVVQVIKVGWTRGIAGSCGRCSA